MSVDRTRLTDTRRQLRPVRTEVEVAADVLMRLFDQRILRFEPKALAAVATATGVPVTALRDAKDRADRAGYRAPLAEAAHIPESGIPVHGTETPVGGTRISDAARPAYARGRAKGSAKGAARRSKQGQLMHCHTCGNDLDADQFPRRADRPGMRWTICIDCRKARSRDRYLSVEKQNALNAARLTFVLSELDEKIGLGCIDCGEPFRPGDHVWGTAALHHVNCPDAPA